MPDLKTEIFQDLNNLVDNGYADNWNDVGQSIYDADPIKYLDDVLSQTGVDYSSSLDAAVIAVREWQKINRPK